MLPTDSGAAFRYGRPTPPNIVTSTGARTYLGSSELSAHFGLGAARQAEEVRVAWANGEVTVLGAVPANRTMTVTPHGLRVKSSSRNE